MKRLMAMLLALALSAGMFGCADVQNGDNPQESESSQVALDTSTSWDVVRPDNLPADYPNTEIRFIYPFNSSGSTTVIYFRLLAEKIKQMEGWKYSVVLNQREGAGGDIGWTAAAEAEADGYTITFTPTSMLIKAIGESRPYTGDAFEYICNLTSSPGVIAVAANSPYETLEDLLQAAQASPGVVSIGVTSSTGGEGLAVMQLEKASGADLNMVPFNSGTEIIAAVSGGHCDALCLNVGDIITPVEDGSLKVLAVGSEERSAEFPDAPTYQECGYDVVQVNSRAIAAPAGTDPAIVQYLSDCFKAAANSPDVQQQIADIPLELDFMSHEEVQALFMDSYEEYLTLWNTSPWM